MQLPMLRTLILSSLLCACSSGTPAIDDPAPVLDRYPALTSGPLEPGSYLVAFNVRPSDVLYDQLVRMDITEDEVAFAPPWKALEPYWIRDNYDGFELEHDVAPGRCTNCYVTGWLASAVPVQFLGIDGIRVADGVIHYQRDRAMAVVQEERAGEWVGRRVSIELLRDDRELQFLRPMAVSIDALHFFESGPCNVPARVLRGTKPLLELVLP